MLLKTKCPIKLVHNYGAYICRSGTLIQILLHACALVTDSSLSMGLVGGIAGGVGGVLLLIILVMAVLLILLIVRIRKSGSQDISTATTTGEALDTCTSYN